MKQLFVTLLLLAGGLIAKSQTQPIPIWNGGFEQWEHPKPFVYTPQNWTTLDSVIIGYSTAEESSDAYSGKAALKLMPLRGTDPTKFRSSFAILGKAKINPSNFTVDIDYSGQPFNYQPQSISGYYKYQPNANTDDSVTMFFICKNYDPFSFIRIADGYHIFQPSSMYTKFNIPIESMGESYPVDSIIIGIFYYSKDTSASPSGYLLIDDLKAEGALSVENTIVKKDLRVFPNPASNFIQIKDAKPNSTYEITDLAGRTLLKGQVQNNHTDVSTLSTGLYLLRVSTKEESWVEKLQIQ